MLLESFSQTPADGSICSGSIEMTEWRGHQDVKLLKFNTHSLCGYTICDCIHNWYPPGLKFYEPVPVLRTDNFTTSPFGGSGAWPSICFIALIWIRRLVARSIIALRRSSIAIARSNRSPENVAAACINPK